MYRLLKGLIPFLIILGLAYHFRAEVASYLPLLQNYAYDIKSRIFQKNPCKEPIEYVIGTFDSRFNISRDYFIDAIKDAEAVWEKPYGKELFTYSGVAENASTLKVNLVYDERQEATQKLKSLGIVVENNRASYDMLDQKYKTLKSKYDQDKAYLDQKISAFNTRQRKYEEQVAYWNSQRGAPEKKYNELQAEKSFLQAESGRIQSLEKKLNTLAGEVNALVVALNRLISTLNLSVQRYNTTSVSRGETFEEGLYVSDGINREINIYEFENRNKLVRVLAHEFGHALGLEHVDDPKAIMYKLNQGESITLSDTDLEALQTKCRAQN